MAKPKITWELVSCGIYTPWEKLSRELPVIQKITNTVPCVVGVEFGYVLNIRKAKGQKLSYCIDHPPFLDDHGRVSPPFIGEVYVKQNDWDFFLGDTVWEPAHDKVGPWRLITRLDGLVLADETLLLVSEER